MVARGRALMREWGASVQCRKVGELVRCACSGPRLVVEEGRTKAGSYVLCEEGPLSRGRERVRAEPGRAGPGPKGARRTWWSGPAEGRERAAVPGCKLVIEQGIAYAGRELEEVGRRVR